MHTSHSNTVRARAVTSAALLAAAGVLGLVNTAEAADGAEPAELTQEVVVTGTRLGEVSGFSTPTPVTVLSADSMQKLALTNIADALNEIPSFAPISTPASNLYFTSSNIGANILDLRGLGASRTLVLVDGRRFVASNARGNVDTNLIPSALLERTEVVTGGASAAYGADAVAGVVNLILKKDLQGITSSVSYGRAQAGDAGRTNFSLAGGSKFADGRGHFMIGGEYEDAEGTGTCYVRNWCYRNINVMSNPTPGVNGYPVQVLSGNQFSTLPRNGLIIAGSQAGTTFDNNGNPVPFHFGEMAGAILQLGGTNDDGRQSWYTGYLLQVPVKRYSGLAHADYDFTDSLQGFAEVSYGRVEGQSLDYPYLDIFTLIHADNAFIPASLRAAMASTGDPFFFLNRSDDDLGYQWATSINQASRVAVGLNGKLGAGDWKWDAYYQYGKNKGDLTIENNGKTAAHLEALDAVAGPNGQIVCRSSLTNPGNGCVPLNLFGYNQFSPAARQYVTGTSWQTRNLEQQVVAANLRGTLFSTWAGPVNAALGAEYREDKASGEADALSNALGWQNSTAAPIDGKVKVTEGYFETAVPLIANKAFAKRFELNGAVRYTHYDLSGNATTWKGGVVYEPVEGILLRATKSRDIRAPNIDELFAPAASGLANVLDPQTNVQNLVPYRQTGNPNLKPEKADTFTAGLVFRPQGALNGWRTSIDYYDIKIKGAIDSIDAQSLVTACFNGTTAACSAVSRNPDGSIALITLGDLNLDEVETEGIEISSDYTVPLASIGGAFNFSINATHVMKLATTYYNGTTVDWAGNPGTPTTGPNLEGVPDWAFNAVATYSVGPASVSLQGRYFNGGTYDARLVGPGQKGYSLTAPNSISDNSMPAGYYLKLAGQYSFDLGENRDLQLFGAIGNLLNRQPPAAPASFLIYYYDTIGRTYTAGARMRF